MQVTHDRHRQTTTMIYWEKAYEQQAAGSQTRCASFQYEQERQRDSDGATKGQIPPPPPPPPLPQSLVNWLIRSRGRYRHHPPPALTKAHQYDFTVAKPVAEDALLISRDSEWRGNESQLTRPLSVRERHHQERLPIHEALTCPALFIVAINCSDTQLTTVTREDKYRDKSSTTPITLCKSSQ